MLNFEFRILHGIRLFKNTNNGYCVFLIQKKSPVSLVDWPYSGISYLVLRANRILLRSTLILFQEFFRNILTEEFLPFNRELDAVYAIHKINQ